MFDSGSKLAAQADNRQLPGRGQGFKAVDSLVSASDTNYNYIIILAYL